MMLSRSEIKRLVEKYNCGEATPPERARLEQWYHQTIQQERLEEQDGDFLFMKDILWEAIVRRSGLSGTEEPATADDHKVTVRPLWNRRLSRIAVAASLVLFACVGIWYWQTEPRAPAGTEIVQVDEAALIGPGGHRATLELADGRQIDLREDHAGIVIGNKQITYDDGSVLEGQQHLAMDQQQEVILRTPKGGMYQMKLPDGSRVWLNASSSLRYAAHLDGESPRIVHLEGEAFFEVSAMRKGEQNLPFLVRTGAHTVAVLGTRFNVSAYPDQAGIRTTLVEGKVRVSLQESSSGSQISRILYPGQQSVSQQGGFEIRNVDPEMFSAWKSGVFIFEDTPLEEAIAQIARWYDIEVAVSGLPSRGITGIVSRKEKLSALLEALTVSSGLHFGIEERRLVLK